jgi:hypothetical protein
MMARKMLIALVLTMLVWGCAQPPRRYSREKVESAPVIVASFASQVVSPGDLWKIYLQARDEDGDMRHIAAVLYQAGVGYYTTEIVLLKEGDRAEFEGYLTLRFPPDPTFFLDRFDMMILIRDQQENRSEPANLPLQMGNWLMEQPPEQWMTAANKSLGNLMIDVVSAQAYNRGSDGGIRPSH